MSVCDFAISSGKQVPDKQEVWSSQCFRHRFCSDKFLMELLKGTWSLVIVAAKLELKRGKWWVIAVKIK